MYALFTINETHFFQKNTLGICKPALQIQTKLIDEIYEYLKFKNVSWMNRQLHAPECIMGNQDKMERNSKVCMEVQNHEKYSWYTILGVFIFQNRR